MPYFKMENQSEYFSTDWKIENKFAKRTKKVMTNRQKAIDINNEMRYAINS